MNASPAGAAAPARRRARGFLHGAMFAATLVTTTLAGMDHAGRPWILWGGQDGWVDWEMIASEWSSGLAFSCTLVAILLAHEMGHYVVARWHGVRATLPLFLPAPPIMIGTFGAFIRMTSPPPDRRALFDIGAAGPWMGAAVALPTAVLGLGLSEVRPIPPDSGIFYYFGDSLLFHWLVSATVGPIPFGYDVIVHPVALAAWFGLLVTALNLLPVGQLDGGHVLYAVFGRWHRLIARGFFAAVVALGFLGWYGWFVWAFLLLAVGLGHPPTLDSATPLDRRRLALAAATLVLFIVTLVPVPVSLQEGGLGPSLEDLVPV